MTISTFYWNQIPDLVPATPGLYAWYLKLEISEADINYFIEQSRDKPSDDKISDLKKFLVAQLVKPLSPPSYTVDMKGKLQPEYTGIIEYVSSIDEKVLLRLAENQEKLTSCLKYLGQMSPAFASPLYIGMAKNLRVRIKGHCRLIEQEAPNFLDLPVDWVEEDASFAKEINKRGIEITSLMLNVMEIHDPEVDPRDIEYLMNRIMFPILGKR